MTYTVAEYLCPAHGRFDSLEPRPAPSLLACPECGELSESVISAPRIKTQWGTAAVRGKPAERPYPHAMDTEKLADGMADAEWKRHRAKVWEDKTRRENRAKVSR
jgi:hypothetical protein